MVTLSTSPITSSGLSPATQDATITSTQPPQAPRETPPGDSISSTTSNECCLVKIWNAICNFFKWLCPCLCGRSKQETKPEITKPEITKLNEGNKPINTIAILAAGRGFMLNYAEHSVGKKIAVAEFKCLQPQLQWQVLYLMVQRDFPLKDILTYVADNEEIDKELCTALGLENSGDLLKTSGRGEDLRKFLQSKVGIQSTPLSTAQPSTLPAQDPGKSEKLPPAVCEFLNKSDADSWFRSQDCDKESCTEILLYLARKGDINAVRNYLYPWLAKSKHISSEVCEATGATHTTTIAEEHMPSLITFLESQKQK